MSVVGSLGRCSVCGEDATVLYPLLAGEPKFCSGHHNPEDAGPFGCDFSGPDDFDIPWGPSVLEEYDPYGELVGYTKKQFKEWHKKFVWTDREGVDHEIQDIDDVYLRNIVGFLRRVSSQGTYFNGGVLRFLEEEQESRKDNW